VLGIVSQAKRVRARLEAVARLNLELAEMEGTQKAAELGVVLALAALVAALVAYALGFLFAAAAAGLDEVLALWLSLLVVAIVILVLATVAGLLAVRFARKVSAPSEAIAEIKRTAETVRTHA